ncbi:MAG: peptidase M14 [Acidobacteria bacterium]|nr:peptidase M14 [Acidobacteriota bacterium]
MNWNRRALLILPLLMLALPFLYFAHSARAQSGVRPTAQSAAQIPSPESVLGFRIGADRRLAKWEQFLEYFRRLDAASDRMELAELGKTTLGRPFVVATISSPDNLRRLAEYREIQNRLSDPRTTSEREAEALIRTGKTVVVITCSIHSTEVGGTFTATELAHRLASEDTPEARQILSEVILLLVPSLNPDGTDIVADWYARTLGTPAEGAAPPELYHHYTGHDNNRDWYAFTQVETQLTVDKILNVWRPQILHDIHQMGGSGARFFVPPYIDPWEPNVDPAIISGVSALGSAIAWDMTVQGKSGIVINGIFDAFTPARAYAHYHAGLRILSETASARLATPVEVPAGQLVQGLNYHAGRASWNFPKPWTGGRWTLRDIVDYQTSGAWALLGHAARYRERHLRNFYDISRRAVEAPNAPFAYLLPEPAVPASIADAARRLNEGLKQVSGTREERHEAGDRLAAQLSNEPSTSEEVKYYLRTEAFDRLIAILKRGGVEIHQAMAEFTADGKRYPVGTRIVPGRQPYGAFAKTLLEVQRYPDLREYPGGPPKRPYDVTSHTLPLLMNVEAVAVREEFQVEMKAEPRSVVIQGRVRRTSPVRVALYQNYLSSMDEGWTRWVFDQYRFPYTTLRRAEVRAGNLNEKYDVIIIPDQSASALVNGLGAIYPQEYSGGLGSQGVGSLIEFAEAGGTIVTFNEASNFAIEELKLPVRNVLKGVSVQQFYCPGSILRIRMDDSSPLTLGIDSDAIAWFEASPAFEVADPARVKVIAHYPETEPLLLSGWILGEEKLRGKAALVEVKLGEGRVVMFGFRPQYRGQSLATIPLVFNSILTSRL